MFFFFFIDIKINKNIKKNVDKISGREDWYNVKIAKYGEEKAVVLKSEILIDEKINKKYVTKPNKLLEKIKSK